MLVEEVKTMESRENQLKQYEVIFIRILMDMHVSKDQIHGIMAMLYGNKPAMDKVVAFIEENPEATESQIIKVASKAVGIKSKNDKNEKIKCKQCGEEFNNEELGLNMLCTQRIKKCNLSNSRPLSYEDSLFCVLQAFEMGLTYPLYEILDKDAIIEYVDENKTVCGSRKIIEHIENDGTDRVCVNNQKVFCDIMRIAEGDRYGVGEKCILIHYERQNEVKNRIVKIKYDDGKIRRIEVFIPYGPLRLEYDEDDLFECIE